MLTIEQHRLLKPKQVLYLTNDGFLCVTVKRLLSEREFKLDLHDIKPESSWQKVFPKGAFALTLLCAGLMLAAGGFAAFQNDPSARLGWIEVGSFWAGASLLSAAWFWLARSEFIAYFHRFSGEPLVLIHTDLPDVAAVQRFVRALDTRLMGIHRPDRSARGRPMIFPDPDQSDPRCSWN
jgi:hypothetical protein